MLQISLVSGDSPNLSQEYYARWEHKNLDFMDFHTS